MIGGWALRSIFRFVNFDEFPEDHRSKKPELSIVVQRNGYMTHVLNIMVGVSQWEREAIGERTRDAMRHKRAKGERVGTVPFGDRPATGGVRLEADDVEQGILSRIRELNAKGLTTRQIAGELNRQELTTRRGTAWRFQYVAHILRSGRDRDQLPAAA